MQYLNYAIQNIVFVVILLIAFTKNSFSYIDPGTGSYIFQLLIAGFIGALFALKMFWNKVKLFFTNLFSK